MHLMIVRCLWLIMNDNLNIQDFNPSLAPQLFQHFTTGSEKSDWQVSFPTFQILCRTTSSVLQYTRPNTFMFYGMSLSLIHLICQRDVIILLNIDFPAFVLLKVTSYLYYWYLIYSWKLKRILQQKWIPTRWIQWPQIITDIKNWCTSASHHYWQGHLWEHTCSKEKKKRLL